MVCTHFSTSFCSARYSGSWCSRIGCTRRSQEKDRNFVGEHFWARGDAVSTVGFELESVKKYIREPEKADKEGRF
jgi:putative transposase